MKKTPFIAALFLLLAGTTNAQLAPRLSPEVKVEQKVGLTDISVKYSRPGKRDRVIFGDVVPFGEIWRTGANENTVISFSDAVVFGKDTLKAGTYSLYTKPAKESWEVIFYSDFSNWGTPEEWNETKVALRVSTKPVALKETVETFTIAIETIQSAGATLTLAWDKTQVAIPFTVPTDAKVMANIKKTMGGPTANDYFGAAQYYYENKRDTKQALIWVDKAIELRPDTYWILRLKALLQAEAGDKKAATETAKKALELAQKDDNQDYVKMLNKSIEEWSK
ncbi:MAG: dihydrolipoamide dehydrogenase [Candidatus Fluviicola riflensis]|nr:MAG: dihydrolipoamide dehydrogenase [Candidatus Fluviicola riflensis]OGS78847.1 MAG: dihydrolipoamide dehydrogenase [Candidatus Fluviicola riflensis]OGS85869.1 MAG: dihydrolipoamide dehydrogenase [Fluviicola sp. RIFCSPHIGHO2_12_FULL_43_24]OGS86278.1 MAG: dihydrolipoamide dehydrogenase [Fluviicola sp. RIFCSPHIGHO2_01_FULL_43_53]